MLAPSGGGKRGGVFKQWLRAGLAGLGPAARTSSLDIDIEVVYVIQDSLSLICQEHTLIHECHEKIFTSKKTTLIANAATTRIRQERLR